jgi:uncharacterized protein (TIGR03435 family)
MTQRMVRLLFGITLLVIAASPMRSQPQSAQKASFEVASVKPNRLGRAAGPPRVDGDGRRFVASNAPLKMILQFAYRPPSGRPLRNSDIIGAPDWSDTEYFDVQARVEEGVNANTDETRWMAQALLEDRFQLKSHWESREAAIYNLVPAKSGSKLQLAANQSRPELDTGSYNPAAPPARGSLRTIANPSASGIKLMISAVALPLDALVNALQSYAGRPVFDRTGLKGLYDIRLEFFLEASDAGGRVASDPIGLPLTTAIEDQLGLKFESSKGPVEVLVIDSVSKPSEN